ncbi:MAG: TssQ family T6SS-associated lipoprotein [Rubrivivax sp.]|nr:TssQ family T6SS-associated lipoprotein [Rubrivivax sp.]
MPRTEPPVTPEPAATGPRPLRSSGAAGTSGGRHAGRQALGRSAGRISSIAALAGVVLAGCASPSNAPTSAATLVPPSLAELMQRPAERALVDGIRLYDDAQYAQAEAQLRKALAAGLADARDRASAHKLLAFITCTTERLADCAAQFAAARAADPAFQLSRSESGHPVWGPVYRRTLAP